VGSTQVLRLFYSGSGFSFLSLASRLSLMTPWSRHYNNKNAPPPGTVVGFFPERLPGLNPDVPIEIGKVVKAWRSPESKRD
jgi:hypothetical protein